MKKENNGSAGDSSGWIIIMWMVIIMLTMYQTCGNTSRIEKLETIIELKWGAHE